MDEKQVFQLQVNLPPGWYRPRVVLEAREKLARQIARQGYEPLPTTFALIWMSSRHGVASMTAMCDAKISAGARRG